MNKGKLMYGLMTMLLLALLATAGMGKPTTGNATSTIANGTATPQGCGGPGCVKTERSLAVAVTPRECGSPNCRSLAGCGGPNCRNTDRM
jgi:hypothetical protein